MSNVYGKYFAQAEQSARSTTVVDHPRAVEEREFAISLLAKRLSYQDRRRLERMVSHLSLSAAKSLCDYVYGRTHGGTARSITTFDEAVAVLRPWL